MGKYKEKVGPFERMFSTAAVRHSAVDLCYEIHCNIGGQDLQNL